MPLTAERFADGWYQLLHHLFTTGGIVSPRGQQIREHTTVSLTVKNTLSNIIISPERKLNYRFMVAEWLWIWFGNEDVATIAQYNSQIAKFSDDGIKFNGAYGPRVASQWRYVLGTLLRDTDSRQAVIQIYERPSTITKDVPCTLSVQFLVRRGQLHTIVCMRSSDIWLGLPYDFFNFSMLANTLAAQLRLNTGPITFHLGSSHLYERDVPKAEIVLIQGVEALKSPKFNGAPIFEMHEILEKRDPIAVPSPWSFYADVLRTDKNSEALDILREVAIF